MNNELTRTGIPTFAGITGWRLQNYMAYTQSMLYDRHGRVSAWPSPLSRLLFGIGPTIASRPRRMAGTLLLHVGVDLFLEGAYDTLGNSDSLEYAGIWLITIVMTLWGMKAP
jgi:SulP family sulfate permease